MPDDIARILITQEEIAKRVKELAEQISFDYKDANLHITAILNGSFIFLADLVRCLSIPVEIDFVSFSSYGSSRESCGNVDIRMDLSSDVKDKDILIVDDIIDTGFTLTRSGILHKLESCGAKSIKICALLDKVSRRKADIAVDYPGFIIPDEFVVGYGMDCSGFHRNLPYIAVIK
ncbi:MAG: hypoxanthine phosphoribosyltransferase [Armatimonadota bacterium]